MSARHGMTSFLRGVLHGLVPILLVVDVCGRCVGQRDAQDGRGDVADTLWRDRWFKYGRSFGLFVLIVAAIVVMVLQIV